jgi:conjugal transfer pilus assembly protein TraK
MPVLDPSPLTQPARRSLHRLAMVALAITATPAGALQVIEARDGVSVEAIMSAREPTRIRIEGAAIVDVFGNVQSNGCGGAAGVAPAATPTVGELFVECDREKGEIYVRPVASFPGVADTAAGKPVNLFISSAHATYTLLLRRSDIPADTILIRDRTQLQARDDSHTQTGPAPSHVRAMKALLIAMASDRTPSDMRVDLVNAPVRLWADARFLLLRRHEGRGFVGETYQLQNSGPVPIALFESHFDRPDSATGGQVLAVSIETAELRPGESTRVFVIRRGGQQ